MNIEAIKEILPDANYLDLSKDIKSFEENDIVRVYPTLKEICIFPKSGMYNLNEAGRRFRILLDIRRAGFKCVDIGYEFGRLKFKECAK